MTNPRRLHASGFPALTSLLLFGLAGCGSEPETALSGQISRNEAQALAEAKGMLDEQRMPPPVDDSGTLEENVPAPDIAASARP